MPISIVAEGGGMRGAYVCGAIDALYSHYGLHRVDVVTGTSASACTLAYYAAGQFYPGYYIWTQEVPSWHFLSFRNLLCGKPFLDIDYMVDVIFKRNVKLDPKRLKDSKIKLVVPVLSCATGETEFFDMKGSDVDIFEVLRAAAAAPIVYNKRVRIGDAYYFDGYFGNPLALDNPHIAETKKIVILSKPLDDTSRINWDREARLLRPILRKDTYRVLRMSDARQSAAIEQCKSLMNEGAVVIAPEDSSGRSLDNSIKNIRRLIQQGYDDALKNEPLRQLMQELKSSPRKDFYFPEQTDV
jgi:predicted patatin/cPLA2 family phospholipase